MRIVSARLQRRIARDFPRPGSAEEVIRLLAAVSESERVQAAIVFAASGDLGEIKREAELAAVDRRDVLLNGGLAYDDWPGVLRPQGPPRAVTWVRHDPRGDDERRARNRDTPS